MVECLINKAVTKRYIMARLKQKRPGWNCTQISGQALSELNAKFKNLIDKCIQSHPTMGKTFKQVF